MRNAIEELTKAICLEPDYMGAWNNRGIFWRKKGECEKSIDDLIEAIRLALNNADIWSNRGNTWSCKGKLGNAINDLWRGAPPGSQKSRCHPQSSDCVIDKEYPVARDASP